MTERVWIILAGMLLVLAAVFLWWNNLSAAFVTAALGACAWFLSYRTQLRKKIKDDDASDEDSTGNIDQE
jgi:uncharacterized membrane protein YdjX (TVP38/TMEM64 family)